MAVRLYTSREVELIRKAGLLAFEAHMVVKKMITPGVTTLELSHAALNYITSKKGKAAFLGFSGFPEAICTSVNDTVVHGIPSKLTVLKEGDIIGVDIGTEVDGYFADTAWTWGVGKISEENKRLLSVTAKSLYKGIKEAVASNRIGAIGASIQEYVESNKYSVVRSLVGHGVGKSVHEEPQIPNFGKRKNGIQIKNGMVLAIEPMVNCGVYDVYTGDDKWSVKTRDGKNSAHFEHTIAVTANGPSICTLPKDLDEKKAMDLIN